jgi:hypothetical protein
MVEVVDEHHECDLVSIEQAEYERDARYDPSTFHDL